MRMLFAVAAAALSVCASSAVAQDQYVSVSGGKSGGVDYSYGSDALNQGGAVTADFKDASSFGVAYGRVLPNNLRAEIALSSRSHDIERSVRRSGLGSLTQTNTIEGEVKVTALDLNLFYDIPLAKGFNLYVGGGVGVADVELNDSFLNDSSSTLSLHATGGASYDIGKSVAVFVEGRWQRIGSMKIETSSNLATTETDIDLSNTAVLGGVRFKF